MSTIQPAEVAWVILLLPGFLASLYVFFDAREDRKALSLKGMNGIAMMIATGSIRTEVVRIVQQAILMLLGVVAMFFPAPHTPPSKFGSAVLITLFVYAFLLAGNSLQSAYFRRKILRKLGGR